MKSACQPGKEKINIRKYIWFLLLMAGLAHANDLPQSFAGLETLELDFTQAGTIRIAYNPRISTVLNKERTGEDLGIKIIDAITTRINAADKTSYAIEYDEGMSVDPGFTIYKVGNEPIEIGSFSATEIIIPGNGNIYLSGHTNNMFNTRRKFKLVGNKFIESKQPFYYVGLETQTNEAITLYASQEMKTSVAKLGKDSKITVLLNEGKNYLIKTSFGLVGWYRLEKEFPVGLHHKSALHGIYFNGD